MLGRFHPAGRSVGHSLQPIWGYPKEKQAGKIQADPEPVCTRRGQRERRHQQGTSNASLCIAGQSSRDSSKARAGGVASKDGYYASVQANSNIPARQMLGMAWDGTVYVDTTLPFGLRSAPLFFTAVADAAQWVMTKRGVAHIFHYVDDFIILGASEAECSQKSKIMHDICAKLGLPPEPAKDMGPTTCLTFLGIEIDLVAMELRLPKDKLPRMLTEPSGWRGRKSCKKRELLSLIGVLGHACKVVRAGRTFTRRLSASTSKLEHFVRLSREARSDIEWWWLFSASWNGVGLLKHPVVAQPPVMLNSDASDNWGCGAYWGSSWFQLPWAGQAQQLHITAKELVPIVVAAALWGPGRRSWLIAITPLWWK